MDTSNYKFVHIGNSNIKKEMYIDIINDGQKPYGGFWACPNNDVEGSISDRTDYILENKYGKFLRYDGGEGCFFNIKPDTKVLNIIDDQTAMEAKNKWNKDGHIDYEQISQIYDAAYVSPHSLSYSLRINEFDNWNVRSLLIFNLDCIEEYLPFQFELQKDLGAYITSVGMVQTIKPKPTNYYSIQYSVYQLFKKKIQKMKQEDSRIDIDKIKFELMNEFKNLSSDSYDMVEAIIINESTKQKKLIRK